MRKQLDIGHNWWIIVSQAGKCLLPEKFKLVSDCDIHKHTYITILSMKCLILGLHSCVNILFCIDIADIKCLRKVYFLCKKKSGF